MDRDRQDRESLLLDLHLDQLDDTDRSWLEAELVADPELRARSDRLRKILRPLDHWTLAPPPPNLADKVLRAIQRDGVETTIRLPPADDAGAYHRRPIARLRDIAAIAACIMLIATVAFPGLSSLRAQSRWSNCASNLGSIFRGTTLYQQAFGGSLPYAGTMQNASWLPDGTTGRPFESNSRHIYLIAKLNYGPKPADFVCPACSKGEPMQADKLYSFNDFAKACNSTYDTLNMNGARPNLRPRMAIAYVGDSNPLFVGGRFNSNVDAQVANSPLHRGKGQNVLILDGSVIRLTSPIYGVRNDNVWLAGDIRRYNGTETPTCPEDAFLIPGYPATDLNSIKRAAQ